MTKITGADQVLALLRAQLERTTKRTRNEKKASVTKAALRQGPLARLKVLANSDEMSQHELSRALVSSLLLEQFGEEIVNAAKFQMLVDDVCEQLSENEAGRKLLSSATGDFLCNP